VKGNSTLALAPVRGQSLRVEKSSGILVRLTRLTETSLIAHWWTDNAGLIKTVAKGARQPRSSFAGKLDLFFQAEIVWAPARHGDLHSLREVMVTDFRAGLRERYVDIVTAGYFCNLLEWVAERDHPEPEMADLLRRGLDYLATSGADLRGVRHFEYQLATLLGLSAKGRTDAAFAMEYAFGKLPATRLACLTELARL
jgi:DNA repair protein RecO (recombination protein O)